MGGLVGGGRWEEGGGRWEKGGPERSEAAGVGWLKGVGARACGEARAGWGK